MSFLFFDYSLEYADPAIASALRQTDDPLLGQSPEKRWLSILMTILFIAVVLVILLGVLSPDFREGGSEQIRAGASISHKPPTEDVERFCLC